MNIGIKILIVICIAGFGAGAAWGACPSADLTGDCFVNLADLAVLAAQWLTGDGVPADMVAIPAGTFQMGDALRGDLNEQPVHAVHVDAFMMGRYEVTNQQFCEYLNNAKYQGQIKVRADNLVYAVGGSNPFCATTAADATSQISFSSSTFIVTVGKGNHPMENVTWWGAITYANWRSQQSGWQACYNLSTGALDPSKQGFRLGPPKRSGNTPPGAACRASNIRWNSIGSSKKNRAGNGRSNSWIIMNMFAGWSIG